MLVHFFETRETSSGVRVGVTGALRFRPTRARTITGTPDEHVLPVPFNVQTDANGRASVTLARTGLAWAWEVWLSAPHAGWGPVTVTVPTGTECDWSDLPRVDPATLTPTAEPEAAWWSALEAAQLGVQAMPDPDDPDVLILTMQSWQLDPADTLAIILPIGA